MSYTFQLRRDTAAGWTSKNPKLHSGEPGIETDTNKLKFGNGVDFWDDLDYFPNTSDLVAGVASVDGRTGVVTLVDRYAALVHVHAISDVTGLISALANKAAASDVSSHIANVSNPHEVTKSQVGLANVDNTSDAAKPISSASQTALDLKAPLASPTFTGRIRQDYVALTDANPVVINAANGNRLSVTLTANAHVLGNPSNLADGQPLLIRIKQDATGGWSMTLGNKYRDPNGYYTGVNTAAGARSYLLVVYDSTDDQLDVLAFAAGY